MFCWIYLGEAITGVSENELQRLDQIQRRAEKTIEEKVGFFRHLTVYIVVNCLLVAVNMIVSREFYWFLIPLAGWTIILIAHFVIVFAFRGERFERWRTREIEKEVQKLLEKE